MSNEQNQNHYIATIIIINNSIIHTVSLWWPKSSKKINTTTIVFNIISMQCDTILNLNHGFTKSPNIHSSRVAQVQTTRSHLCHKIQNMNPVSTRHLLIFLLIQEFICTKKPDPPFPLRSLDICFVSLWSNVCIMHHRLQICVFLQTSWYRF